MRSKALAIATWPPLLSALEIPDNWLFRRRRYGFTIQYRPTISFTTYRLYRYFSGYWQKRFWQIVYYLRYLGRTCPSPWGLQEKSRAYMRMWVLFSLWGKSAPRPAPQNWIIVKTNVFIGPGYPFPIKKTLSAPRILPSWQTWRQGQCSLWEKISMPFN